MDIKTIALGVAFLVIGAFFFARSLKPELSTGKLKAMIDMWGAKKGVWLYRSAYSGIPLFLGITIISAGLSGFSILELLAN